MWTSRHSTLVIIHVTRILTFWNLTVKWICIEFISYDRDFKKNMICVDTQHDVAFQTLNLKTIC